jgi:hypothetical protein
MRQARSLAMTDKPEDVDPKALEIARRFLPSSTAICLCAYGEVGLARAITALLRERQTYCPECGMAGECACIANWKARASEAEAALEKEVRCISHAAFSPEGDCIYCDHEQEKERADTAEAKLRERDEEIEGLKAEYLLATAEAEERAQKAEAAVAKKDEALREIIAVIQRTYGSDPSQRGVSKNRIERIAKGGLGE